MLLRWADLKDPEDLVLRSCRLRSLSCYTVLSHAGPRSGPCARAADEPRQGRKAAALSRPCPVPQVIRIAVGRVSPVHEPAPMSNVHQPLARKWRPKRFDDVIGQRGVVDTLRNALGSGRLAQSFIFAGPRGVGKTTTARLMAMALNCVDGPTATPCGECDACREIAEGRDMDVLEIDAATHTGVDDVRQVIVEPLSISPMRDRFKIFIIDEVHRLSKNAFDALLKSVEEPPPYVKFMMATTDPQNVPITIQSRSQVFELRALPFNSIREKLRTVMTDEGIIINDAALALVARHAEGSMRDALSALDQVLAFTATDVTADDVSTVLGLVGRDMQFDIVETVAAESLMGVFGLADRVVESGVDLRLVCRELARLVRDLMVLQIDPTRYADPEIASEGERPRLEALAQRYSREDLMRAFDLLSRAEFDIRQSSQPRHTFEMMLVKWVHLRQLTPLGDLIARLEQGGLGGPVPARQPPAALPRPVPSRPTPPPASPAPAARPQAVPASPAPAVRPQAVPAAPAPAVRPQAMPTRPNSAVAPAAPASASAPVESTPAASPVPSGDPKAALLAAIREQNRMFYGMVVAQALVAIEGDSVVFTFAAVHRHLRTQLEGKRAWIEQLARNAAGRTLSVTTRDLPPVAQAEAERRNDPRRAEFEARAKAEPTVQAVLDVFGGQIEDIEETK
jgi:DNA polymerase-3 subunit gamma/tau